MMPPLNLSSYKTENRAKIIDDHFKGFPRNTGLSIVSRNEFVETRYRQGAVFGCNAYDAEHGFQVNKVLVVARASFCTLQRGCIKRKVLAFAEVEK